MSLPLPRNELKTGTMPVPPPCPPTLQLGPRIRRRWEVMNFFVRRFDWTRGAELGLWQGRTITCLLGSNPKLHMIGVDLWQPQPDNDGPESYEGWDHGMHERRCRASVKRYRPRVELHKMLTTEAAELVPDGSLDFFFVDADHSEAGCARDIEAWMPKLKPTGWIFGHDITWKGVRAACDRLVPGYEIAPDVVWLRPKNPAPGWADEFKGA